MKKTVISSIVGNFFTREAPAGTMPDFNKGGLVRTMDVKGFDVEARTVELAFSSELEVERWFGIEILDHDPSSVRLDRIRDGGALLVNHDWDDQVGVVVSVNIDADRVGRAVVRFGKSARADEIFQDIVDEIRRHVSVGYRALAAQLVEKDNGIDTYRIVDWEPYEISIVSVPADTTVGVGRQADKPKEEGGKQNPETGNLNTPAVNPILSRANIMNEKILRDASGNLVRAMVDAEGKITQVLEVIERAGDDINSTRSQATSAERARISAMLELGRSYNAPEIAQQYITEGRTEAELTRALLEHINTNGGQRQQQQPARQRSASGSTPLPEMPNPIIGLDDREIRSYSIFNAIRALANPNDAAMQKAAAFEFECSEAAQRALGRASGGILIPQDVLSRAFNAGGAPNAPAGSQTGSNLVATDFRADSFIDLLRNKTTIMRMARIMGGLVGNVEIPKQTNGATAYWLGEGDDATEGTPQIGQLDLSPKTVAAYTDITRRLLMQSTPDAEGIVRSDLLAAMAQAIDYAGYYGSGTNNQPRGLANYTGLNAVSFAGVQPSYSELVAMETEIAADNADVNNMAYVLNARGRGAAKTTLKFPNGTSTSEAGVIWEAGNTLNGYRTEVTNQVATGDVFFGNFADMVIGLWGGLDLTVDTASLSKSGGLRIVVFQDVDFVLRRTESFCLGRKTS